MAFDFWKRKTASETTGEADGATLRETEIATRLRESAEAKSDVSAYWKRMRAYYDGTHETAKQTGAFLSAVDLPWRPAAVPDGYMHVESQIEADVPDFEFCGRDDGDAGKASQRERVVRYVVQSSEIASKNAVNERRLNLYGTAVWKLAVTAGADGETEIGIENPSPEAIYPDPCATGVDDCEYIACVYRMNTDRAARLFADDLAHRGLSADVLWREAGKHSRGAILSDAAKTAGQTVEVIEYWHRQSADGSIEREDGETVSWQAGDIALSILINGTEVRYVPKFWSKTSCRQYPFVVYGRIPNDYSLWGKSELEAIVPLIDAADRQLAFAQLNTAFFANDILVYEENAFAPDCVPENRPGAVWKLRPGMMDKVARLGGLASDSVSHYEIAEKYRAMMKEALGNYDFLQGDSTTHVTTATGLALLGDYANKRVLAKNMGKKAGFERLYRLIDCMALEFFDEDKVRAVTGDADVFGYGTDGYLPRLDVIVSIGAGVDHSRSFTLSALSELAEKEIDETNYPIVRAYIGALGIPERAALLEALDRRFAQNEVTDGE